MSSVLDYFTGGIADTYNETVNYWAKDGSVADGIDAVVWSAQNTDIVIEETKKGVEKSIKNLNVAVSQDTNKLIIIAVLGIGAYYYYKKGNK